LNKNLSNNDLIEDFLTYHRVDKGHSKETIRAYRYDLTYMFKILKEIKKREIKVEQLNYRDIRSLIRVLKDEKENCDVTLARKISCLNSFFHFLTKYEYIEKNVMEKIEIPKITKKAVRIPTEEDVKRLFEYIHKRDYRNEKEKDNFILFFHLTYVLMARIGEIPKIKVRDFDFKRDRVIYEGKGKKERIGLLDPKTKELVKNYIEKYNLTKEDYIVRNRYGEKITTRGLQYRVSKILEELEFDDWVSAHPLLRKRPASSLDKKGEKLKTIQVLLGHEDPKTTRKYVADDVTEISRRFEKRHPLENLH
jgi:integrase/recombinase XerC